ncbi:hypothetical protein DV515_00008659, partial [Chloebia gouldiae]
TKEDTDATDDERNLIQTVADLFLAGTETTATTLLWALLYMVIYPDIQEKVQKELDAVVGCSHVFCYEDRKKLPYANAVIHEIQRYSNILLIALPRMSTPDRFNPGHFLDKDGNFVNREAFLPLAIGFTFTLPEGVMEVNIKFVFGSTMKPPPYQLCAIPQ